MATCRYCAEEIKPEAIICPHCTHVLNYALYSQLTRWEYCRVFFIGQNGNEIMINIKNGFFSLKAGEIWDSNRYHENEVAWNKASLSFKFQVFFKVYEDNGIKKFKVVKELNSHVMDVIGALGEIGWEMVGFDSNLGNHIYVLKRQIA